MTDVYVAWAWNGAAWILLGFTYGATRLTPKRLRRVRKRLHAYQAGFQKAPVYIRPLSAGAAPPTWTPNDYHPPEHEMPLPRRDRRRQVMLKPLGKPFQPQNRKSNAVGHATPILGMHSVTFGPTDPSTFLLLESPHGKA